MALTSDRPQPINDATGPLATASRRAGSTAPREARRRSIFRARDDQIRLAEAVTAILETSEHAYLEAPTGSGKTLTMALIGEKSAGATKVYLAHSIDIVDQTARQMDVYAAAGLIANRSAWKCLTWQSYRQAVRRGRLEALIGTSSPELVLVDECHIGGGDRGESNLSFEAIRETAQKVVWISATPWDINEAILGPREARSAVLGMQEAFGLGLLNATDIVRIDCGLKLRAAVAQLERASGSAFSSLATQSVIVDQTCAEQAYDDLSAQVEQLLERPIRPSDVSTIVRYRIRLLADLYLQRHMSERAMFWLPNQAYAKECARYISERLPGGERAEAIVHDPGNSRAEAEFAVAARDDFSRDDGAVRVACVVFRLREGFDCAGLRLGFDCSWSPRNLRGTVQKIGRLTRRSAGKPRSQYYYAVDVKTVAGARRQQISEAFLGSVQAALRTDVPDARFTAEAIIEAGAIAGAMSGNGDYHPRRFQSQGRGSAREATSVHVPLFEFDDVTGYAEVSRATLDAAFVDEDERLEDTAIRDIAMGLLEAIEAGAVAEEMPAAVRNALRRCTYRLDDLFDVLMARRLSRAAPELASKWKCALKPCVIERMKREDAIVIAIERGKRRPPIASTDGQILSRALSQTNRQFRPDLAARMAAIGQYEAKAERDARQAIEAAAHVERIVGAIEAGGEPPHQSTADRRRLTGWLSPVGRKTRADVRARIQLVRPDLMPKGITYAERDAARQTKQAALVEWVSEHQRLPPAKTEHGRNLNGWLHSTPTYLPRLLEDLIAAARCETLRQQLAVLTGKVQKKRKALKGRSAKTAQRRT